MLKISVPVLGGGSVSLGTLAMLVAFRFAVTSLLLLSAAHWHVTTLFTAVVVTVAGPVSEYVLGRWYVQVTHAPDPAVAYTSYDVLEQKCTALMDLVEVECFTDAGYQSLMARVPADDGSNTVERYNALAKVVVEVCLDDPCKSSRLYMRLHEVTRAAVLTGELADVKAVLADIDVYAKRREVVLKLREARE